MPSMVMHPKPCLLKLENEGWYRATKQSNRHVDAECANDAHDSEGPSKGINNDYDLLYADGASATTGGGILMYTCNGANYHDVTITFWR